jgi:hypothetical protein
MCVSPRSGRARRLNMADDPELSMAYTTALKSAVVPTLHLDGRFSAVKRLYVDSRVLVAELSGLNIERRAHAEGRHKHQEAVSHASRMARHRFEVYGRSSSSHRSRRPRARSPSLG